MAESADIFISHGLNRHFAQVLAEKLRARFLQAGSALTVFMDVDAVRVGTAWRPEICQRLQGCVGAAFVLTQEAVRERKENPQDEWEVKPRPWIVFEASNLLLRRMLYGGPMLLPLYVTGPGEKPLDALADLRWFEPGGLGEIKPVRVTDLRVPPRDLDDEVQVRAGYEAEAERLAELIVKPFVEAEATLVSARVPEDLETFFEDLAESLGEVPPHRLRKAFRTLSGGSNASAEPTGGLLTRAVAYGLIYAPPEVVLEAFTTLVEADCFLDQPKRKERLFERIELTQVPESVAAAFARACLDPEPGRRTVVFRYVPPPQDSEEESGPVFERVARRLHQRVYLDSPKCKLLKLTGVTGEGVAAEVVQAAEASLRKKVGSADPAAVARSSFKYMFLFPGGDDVGSDDTLEIAEALRARWGEIPRVAVGVRTEDSEASPGPAGAQVLHLPMTVDQEREMRRQFWEYWINVVRDERT